MWVTADDGRLVNLAHVRQVVVDGKKVIAVLDEQAHVRLIEPTKAAPQHYVDQIAVALSNGTLHVDLRHV
jgi:hypothetical protein